MIDAMNVIGAVPDGWWRDRPAALARLVAQVDSAHRRGVLAEEIPADGIPVERIPAEWIIVVADGSPTAAVRPGTTGSVEVRFAAMTGHRGPNAADRVIESIVAADDDPATLTVVTSDRDLVDRVEQLGASTIGARTFRRSLAP